MATEWYYTRAGQQQGPVSGEQLQSMISAGQVSSADLVWNESMPDWVPARQAPELSASPSPASFPSPYPTGVIGYAAPTSDGVFATPRALDMLRQTRPWARFLSIIIFIGSGLMFVLALIFMLALGNMRGGPPAAIGLFYVAFAILNVMPGIFLSRYASNISTLQRMNRSTDLEAALEAQKSLWKYIGIVTAVIVCIYVLIIIIAIPLAFMA